MYLIKYKNATKVKLKNRRVIVFPVQEDLCIKLKTISSDLQPRASHIIYKNKLVNTTIKITDEAALALFICLGEELAKKGLIKP